MQYDTDSTKVCRILVATATIRYVVHGKVRPAARYASLKLRIYRIEDRPLLNTHPRHHHSNRQFHTPFAEHGEVSIIIFEVYI